MPAERLVNRIVRLSINETWQRRVQQEALITCQSHRFSTPTGSAIREQFYNSIQHMVLKNFNSSIVQLLIWLYIHKTAHT